MPGEERLLSVRAAARVLGISPKTLRGWVKEGKLIAVKISPRTTRVAASELERLIHQAPAAQA